MIPLSSYLQLPEESRLAVLTWPRLGCVRRAWGGKVLSQGSVLLALAGPSLSRPRSRAAPVLVAPTALLCVAGLGEHRSAQLESHCYLNVVAQESLLACFILGN